MVSVGNRHAMGMHVVHRQTCRQNTHAHKIKIENVSLPIVVTWVGRGTKVNLFQKTKEF